MSHKPKILLLYTGGTIGMVRVHKTGSLLPFNFDQLLEKIPELELLECSIKAESFSEPIDSSNMHPTHWVKIASIIQENYLNYDGFVILHGSDTMSYSASALSFMLENLRKPVIFTGSQLPIGDLRTDAKENVITAIQIASLQKNGAPLVQEVCVYFEYKLFRGNRTTKISAEQFEAYDSPNYPALGTSGVNLEIAENFLFRWPASHSFCTFLNLDSSVLILKLFPGLGENILDSILSNPHLKVLILETFGSGNAPTDSWFLKQLEDSIRSGILIVNVTQCAVGRVRMGQYTTSVQLKKMGVINGGDLTTEAAVCKAMYLLGNGLKGDEFRDKFEVPLRGEMSKI